MSCFDQCDVARNGPTVVIVCVMQCTFDVISQEVRWLQSTSEVYVIQCHSGLCAVQPQEAHLAPQKAVPLSTFVLDNTPFQNFSRAVICMRQTEAGLDISRFYAPCQPAMRATHACIEVRSWNDDKAAVPLPVVY